MGMMNLPNSITASRVVLSFAIALLLCVQIKWVQFFTVFVFIVACITDWLDGYVARKYKIETIYGKFMDALADKIMVIGLFFILLGLDMYGDWNVFAMFCAFVSAAREFFVSGIRMLAATKQVVLSAETLGKYKAGMQMYSIGAIIFSNSLVVDFGLVEGLIYNFFFYTGILTLGFSTFLSVMSGLGYGFKYSYLLKS